MALNLIDGVPGCGKTQWVIKHLIEESGKTVPPRPVYYANIQGLKVPGWIEIDPREWEKCPSGSLIVVDECQKFWPVRKAGSQVPLEVAAFATHRHSGVDIFLVTQDGSLLDQNARKLVSPYRHLERPNGASYSKVWTFPAWCDWRNTTGQQTADVQRFTFDKGIWTLYHSADIHTHKFKMPRRVLLLVPALALLVGAGWFGYHILMKSGPPKVEAAKAGAVHQVAGVVGERSLGQGRVKTVQEYVSERMPRIQGLPYSAAIYDDLTKPVSFPMVSACVLSKGKERCSCYSQQGTPLPVALEFCLNYVDHGAFDPFLADTAHGARDTRQGVAMQPQRVALQSSTAVPSAPFHLP